jgi:hypothetical protein
MRRPGRASKEEVSQFACPNPACSYHGKRPAAGGKLWVDQWMGKEKNLRRLGCGHCRTTFSERHGRALEEARRPATEGEKMVAQLQAGCGIRRPARLTGHARSPVARYAVVAGTQAQAVQAETLRELRGAEIQADEKWGLVGKKRSALRRRG